MKPILTLITISLLVGVYQVPQAETFLSKHDIQLNLSEKVPYGANAQTEIETLKVSLLNPTTNKNITNTKYTQPTLLPSSNIDHKTIEPSEIVTKNVKKQCTDGCTVVMMGDSMMGDVARSYKRMIKKEHPDWNVIDMHKPSTGLCNKAYYDWPGVAKQIISDKKPDYLYILIGMNDAQGIVASKPLVFGKDGWKEEYKNRVSFMKSLLEQDFVSDWKWMEIPTVSSETFNNKLSIIRDVQKQVLPEDKYIDIEPVLGTNKDVKKIDSKTRAGDGIHLNNKSADAIAKFLATEKI